MEQVMVSLSPVLPSELACGPVGSKRCKLRFKRPFQVVTSTFKRGPGRAAATETRGRTAQNQISSNVQIWFAFNADI